MNNKMHAQHLEQLFKALSFLKEEDYPAFFTDLCTVNELQALGQRLAVAKSLADGKTYVEIEKSTAASTATISRIAKCLSLGAGGYVKVLKRLNESNKSDAN